MSDELAKAVAQHVEKEVAAVREKLDEKIDFKMKEIWDDLNRRYRDRIVVVLSVALALMVGGFALSTVTATREANNAVIEFQNSIIARQKAVIESEDRVTVAAAKLTKAEADLAVVTKKLYTAGEDLKEVTVALKDARTKFDDLAKSAPKK